MQRNYIDLFSGCGGVSLGFGNEGWDGVFAIEKDKMAFDSFKYNFLSEKANYRHFENWPSWLSKEPHLVEELLNNTFYRDKIYSLKDKVTLVVGGPPCQGFSVGGKRDGDDPRNKLVYDLLNVVDFIKPSFVIIENVSGIARQFKSKPGELKKSMVKVILNRLEGQGYISTYKLLNCADFGVPQLRKRVIILGVKKELINSKIKLSNIFDGVLNLSSIELKKQLGLPLDRYVNIGEALHDLSGDNYVTCPDAPKFDTSTYIGAESQYSKLMREGIQNGEIPNSHRITKHTEKVKTLYIKAHKEHSPGRLKRQFLLDNGTKTRKKVLLDPNKPSTTITTHPDEFIHFKYPRNITVREMARIQSFPDKFKFLGRYTLNGDRRGLDVARCAQVGNAIPPLLGQAIAKSIDKIIDLIESEKLKEFELANLQNGQIALF